MIAQPTGGTMTEALQIQLELFAQQMSEALRPIIGYQEQLAEELSPVLASLARTAEAYEQALKKSLEKFAKPLEAIARTGRLADLIQSIGLLPHSSLPVEILESAAATNAEQLRQAVRQFYENDWGKIAAVINKRISKCDIDNEAKATMREALAAHKKGYYRSVCRLLLPEIERVFRVEFRANKPGNMKMAQVLEEKSDHLSLVEFEPGGYFSLILVQRLTEHLYEQINTEEQRQKFENDPVPNRHAVIHGIIIYNSIWNSLNVIFLTDIAFQIVSLAKSRARDA
jgi:hypothetical protein